MNENIWFVAAAILILIFIFKPKTYERRDKVSNSQRDANSSSIKKAPDKGTPHRTHAPTIQKTTTPKNNELVSKKTDSTSLAPLAPTVLSGKAYVIDGDSLVIANQELRLFGIDAPEFDHPYGKSAKSALIKLCNGQIIRAEIIDTDIHGRKVARCTLPDGRDLSAEMVKLGLAIDWAKFSGGIYRHLEIEGARKKLWLADARQKGRMHVWEKYAQTKAKQ